ncbi:SpoIID/LytB domain protein [Hyella patelloides LEGE 07179]|uniref:SpoIID/LytB domain protein n=1 Tax=Hyella patelloides LEGE 07179 TaxID=945734 RepID=A0A563VKX5_9CYAN|nr:SpoIID/LytB domain-containing protein [Hyella patelloides]VEP11997.1 SpoIID/LytB domain protein [Hyella patelloides LEGE 07179]
MKLQQKKTIIPSLVNRLLINRKYPWFFSLLLWLVLVLPAQALELRVAIQKNISSVKVGSSTTAVVKDNTGNKIGELTPMAALSAQPKSGKILLDRLQASEIIVEPTNNGYVWIGDRWYRGKTRLILSGNSITAINHVDLEHYLYSVVGAEAVSTWPIEALKAQAVAARSYALYKRKTGQNSLYDVDTTISTQVYKGLNTEYVTTHEAVNSTAGQIMTYNNSVILAAFHSSSGGHTENVEDIWTSPLPYLRGVIDYDHESPVFEWDKYFPLSQFNNLLGIGVGNIKNMIPEKVTPQGRIVSLKIVGDRGTTEVSGKKIRKALDLRSTLFRIQANGSSVKVYGRGFGHGLGLSQWGAYHLAKQGVGYNQILAHYYQNASLSQFR